MITSIFRYRLPKLSKGKVKNVDIQPAEHIEYPKCTQTDESHLQQLIKGTPLIVFRIWAYQFILVILGIIDLDLLIN